MICVSRYWPALAIDEDHSGAQIEPGLGDEAEITWGMQASLPS